MVLDRVIVDRNARVGDGTKLVNEQSRWDYDGEGYYIRSGIIVVPKGAVIQPGTSVYGMRLSATARRGLRRPTWRERRPITS